MKLRKFMLLVLTLTILLIAIGCTNKSSQDEEVREKIVLGLERSLLPSSVWVAESKGYFKEQGLDVEVKEFNSGKASLLAMLNGDQGIDISAAAPTPIMFNSFGRNDFYYFATFASSNKDIKLTARKDKGISAANDLKGKKIGTTMGTTGQFVVDTLLIYRQIDPTEVEILDFKPPELPNALHNGDVDAIVIWEPHGHRADELLGEDSIKIPISDVYTTTFNFLTLKEFADNNPKTLEKFLKAIVKATDFINNNKEESQEITSQRLGLDKDVVGLYWDDFDFEISLDQTWLVNIENEARWAIQNNLTDATQVPNYLDYTYTAALDAVLPKEVTTIR